MFESMDLNKNNEWYTMGMLLNSLNDSYEDEWKPSVLAHLILKFDETKLKTFRNLKFNLKSLKCWTASKFNRFSQQFESFKIFVSFRFVLKKKKGIFSLWIGNTPEFIF